MAARVKHRTVVVDIDAQPEPTPRQWPWPWYLVAVLGAVAVLLAGWLILAALTTVGWLTSPEAELPAALMLAGRVLVLAHGAPVDIGGQTVSLAPLGLTALLIFLTLPVTSLAGRQAATQSGNPDDTGQLWVDGQAIVARVGGTFAAVYATTLSVAAFALGAGSWRAVIGSLVVGGIAGFWGAARGVGHRPTQAWPPWLRAVPSAMAAAVLTVVAGAGVALGLGLWDGRDGVMAVTDSLEPATSGLILLIAIHLAYLPNLFLAMASWVLGAGVTLGDGSLLTVLVTDVGVLPAIPVLGAVPSPGLNPPGMAWWLAVGVVAGVVAALAVALARPRARFDETALVGGLSGVSAGLLIALACEVAAGGLGTQRLAHIGARMPELLVFAPTILGLAGLVAGLVLGLVRRPGRDKTTEDSTA